MPIGLHTAELNFETTQEIGQEGKNSQVFLAHDKQLDGQLVVKKIDKKDLVHASEYYREAKILYASSHPNVVKINYGCSDSDFIYIAMPFYKNGSLKKLLDKRFLTVREVLRYGIQFLSGLNNIHAKKLLHFDIKPDNILISDSNEALLSDFGLSKAMDGAGYADPDLVYGKQIPPEALTSSQKTFHFDIYLAGLTLYRMVNGNDHYSGQLNFATQDEYTNAIKSGLFPDRSAYLVHVPVKLQKTINKALSLELIDRHQSVLELINELSEVDECLDWSYSKTSSVERWEKNCEDRLIVVTLDKTNVTNIIIEATKKMLVSGKKYKITDHCHNNLTNGNVKSKIKKALQSL